MLWSDRVTSAQRVTSSDTANQALEAHVDRPLAVRPALVLWGAVCLTPTLPCHSHLLPYQLSHFTIYEFLWDKTI